MQEEASLRDDTVGQGEIQQQPSRRQQHDHGDDAVLLSDVEGIETSNTPDGAALRREDKGAGTGWEFSLGILVQSVAVFMLAGLLEIGGGWLVWQALREGKPAWWGVLGGVILIGYGIVATWQPHELDFGRVYAAYGGYFIVLSLLWGVYVDKALVMDKGDVVGSLLSVAGALCICFWPRGAPEGMGDAQDPASHSEGMPR